MRTKIFFNVFLVFLFGIFTFSFIVGCSNIDINSDNVNITQTNYDNEQRQIEATITTSFYLLAPRSINNTINFTNVLSKKAEIKIIYSFNNGSSFSDIVLVDSGSRFSKTYTGGYSIASFKIKILNLQQ